ncbi:hypothetical protein [Nonomuraea sp. NPDC005692]|uniref:hypothetical protein n=1 Tax=Nonomuraea sp. NPDC005692 TaxID=3157168 RepID=UPI0033E14ED6
MFDGKSLFGMRWSDIGVVARVERADDDGMPAPTGSATGSAAGLGSDAEADTREVIVQVWCG